MDAELEHRLSVVESRSKSNVKRLDKVEKQQDDFMELVTSVKVLAEREQNVETDVKEIKSDVKALAAKPAKRWEGIVEKAIATLVAALIGFLLARIGIN